MKAFPCKVTLALRRASDKVPEDKSPALLVVRSAKLEPVLLILDQSIAAAALMSALMIESLVISVLSILLPRSETLAEKIARKGHGHVLWDAVYNMLPSNKLRKPMLKRLIIK